MAKRILLRMMRLALAMTVVKMTVFALESASIGSSMDSQMQSTALDNSIQRELQSFYTKYDHYPPYCAIPEEMNSRSIPPLEDNLPHTGNSNNNKTKSLIGETRLVHVTAIVRHGARTPWSSEMKCWNGYWDSPRTGKWDCDLTTYMASPKRVSDNDDFEPALLFEKKYDALMFPKQNLVNTLNGTCQMGQLLQQGYDQQIVNGQILREAYAYKEGEMEHDQRMRLLNTKVDDVQSLLTFPNLYFRADDYQRTVMSGQILLKSLFDPELTSYRDTNPRESLSVPLHIADKDRDIVDANEHDCPRLKTIKEEAMASKEYQTFYNSEASQKVRDFMDTKLGMDDDSSVLDCFMCTICTDRPLPSAVDDCGEDDSWFSKLTKYEIQKYTTIMNHNNGEYAKLGIGPLWFEIMKHINHVLEDKPAPKLALFAGHDTTLMPLLATLGLWKDTEWAGYASMMLIEIHEIIDGRSDPDIYTSSFAFRLLYNGKILTPMVDGCHPDAELCDIVHLKAIVDPIATRDTDCSVRSQAPDDSPTSNASSDGTEQPSFWSSFTMTTSSALFVTLIVLSGFGGSAITFTILRKRFQTTTNNRRVDYGGAWSIDDDDDYGLELTEGRLD